MRILFEVHLGFWFIIPEYKWDKEYHFAKKVTLKASFLCFTLLFTKKCGRNQYINPPYNYD